MRAYAPGAQFCAVQVILEAFAKSFRWVVEAAEGREARGVATQEVGILILCEDVTESGDIGGSGSSTISTKLSQRAR